MKTYSYFLCGLFMFAICSCNDFLDREPLSDIIPENYLNTEEQLGAYTVSYYSIIPTLGDNETPYASDRLSDCVAGLSPSDIFVPGRYRVPDSGGSWNFRNIYVCNYFLENVLPKWQAGTISGNSDNIEHYIGEMYFLRAFEYFKRLRWIGDYPILTQTYPDDMDILIDISKRMPRNEVARFIIQDCDSAIVLMSNSSPDGKRNRLSKRCAYLLKSRVALYEGTWLKYFKGTAFVPGGPGWPGNEKEYNAGYTYPSGSIDNEINYFLEQAMDAAEVVADQIVLESNYGRRDASNPYIDMFKEIDLSPYNEILFWRRYDNALGIKHNTAIMAASSNHGYGVTRGFVERFLMANGLPIYAPGSGYQGDDWISWSRNGRDQRLLLFLKNNGDTNIYTNAGLSGTTIQTVEPRPDILTSNSGARYSTGLVIRKFGSTDAIHGFTNGCYTGFPIFRAAEAYLNYMEACYERKGSLDDKAKQYWADLRSRANVDTDFEKTIAYTDLAQEALMDWGVYSAGQIVDETLYNIRRERSCELFSEGLRYDDLRRWRSMDQMITTPYHIEGMKIWGPLKAWYTDSELVYGKDNPASTVSDPALSLYLRPYEILASSVAYEGYRWTMAHYLEPISFYDFLITSANGDVATSPIYQNPGWPIAANQAPIE